MYDADAVVVGRVRSKELIAGIGRAGEVLHADHRVIPGTNGDSRAKTVGLELEVFRIATCANGPADVLRRFNARCVQSGEAAEDRGGDNADGRIALGLRDVALDVVRSLVAEREGEFVMVAHDTEKRPRETDDRAAIAVERLIRVGRQVPFVDDDLEIAIEARSPLTAGGFGDRLDTSHDGAEIGNGLARGASRDRRFRSPAT